MLKQSLISSKSAILFLLPVFFVLHGFTENYPLVPLTDAIKLIVQYILVSLLLTLVFKFIFKSWQQSIMFTFFLMCLQFFFGVIHDLLKAVFPQSFFSRYIFILPLVGLLIIFVFLYFLKRKKAFDKAEKYFTITLVVLLFVELFFLMPKLFSGTGRNTVSGNFISCNHCSKPNIYLILADEYAGHEELRDLFSFDNTSFENELKNRGFHVVNHASSNYNYTPYSMASLFDMNYLRLISEKSNNISNRNISLKVIDQNNLTIFLENLGYDFINLSLFDFAGKPSEINKNEFYSTRANLISARTLTTRIHRDLWFHFITSLHLDLVKRNYLNALSENIQNQYQETLFAAQNWQEKPKFVYSHFIMPHYPYLFDKNGQPPGFEKALQSDSKDLYLQYLEYSNQRYLSLIDSILKKDVTRPIIIFMSDHGFTKYQPPTSPAYNFNNMINIYFPDNTYPGVPDTLSNVNLFRVVLNEKFGQHMPLLKDSTIFLKEY